MRGLAFVLVAVALLAGSIPAPVGASHVGGMYGGDLRVALPSAASLDPLQFEANRIVQELVYESLSRLGPDQLPVPSLAASWTVDTVGGTVTFDLRGARWSDGAVITAQDVKWSFDTYLTAGVASGFVPPDVVDGDTVRFTITSGGGDFLGNAATLPVAWKAGSTSRSYSGPFVVTAESASTVVMAANAGHWNGRPYVDSVSFLFPYTLDRDDDGTTKANDAACALMKRQVHLIGWPVTSIELNTERDCADGFGGWSDGVNRTLGDPRRLVPHLGSTNNPALRLLQLGMNTENPFLQAAALRLAITRAVDRDLIADSIELGTDIADSPVSPANLAWFDRDVPQYRVPRVIVGPNVVPTLESVNAFLTESGYLDTDGDGWREDPAGSAFALMMLTPNKTADPRTSKYLDLVTKLRAIGLNVAQQDRPLADLRAAVRSGAYDLYVDELATRGEPSFLFDFYHRDGRDNLARIDDPQLNAVLDTVRDALDGGTRLQAVLDVQTWVAERAVSAPIVHLRAINSYDKATFEGWVHALGGIVNFWSFVVIRATQRGPLSVTVDAFEASLQSGASTSVLVTVRDTTDNLVAGVELELVGQWLSTTMGTTDASGTLLVAFDAPDVSAPTSFPITVTAYKEGYVTGEGNETIAVHPPVRTFLVTLFKESSTAASGSGTLIRVTVYDETNATNAAGVAVTLTASPADLNGRFAQASGVTDASGSFETTFTADVTVASRFLIAATVSRSGYEVERVTTSIEVSARSAPGTPVTPALDTISMVALVASLAALYGWRQRRKWSNQGDRRK